MPSVNPAAYGPDAAQPRVGPFRSSPSPARPSAHSNRSASARLRIMLYRHRWLRWAVAGGAALTVLIALDDDRSEPPDEPPETVSPGLSDRLPPGTRGVPVPTGSQVVAEGDRVDVHAILDGAAIVQDAPVVSATDREVIVQDAPVVSATDREVIVAVPAEQVDAIVDALTTGGVILVLVPVSAGPAAG